MPRTSNTTCGLSDAHLTAADEKVRASQGEYHLIVLLMCAAALAASFVLQPHEEGLSLSGLRWPFHCWLHETFGIRCALCGMSRSFCSLAHGEFGASVGFHRLGPVLFAFVCLQIPYRLYALAARPGTIARRVARTHFGLGAFLCAAIACNWFLYLEGLIV